MGQQQKVPAIGEEVVVGVPAIGEEVVTVSPSQAFLQDPTRKPASAEDYLPKGPQGSALWRFASEAGAALNPVTMVKGLIEAARDPKQALKNIYGLSEAEAVKALEMYRKGRYSEMIGHGMAAALPIIGPAAAAAGEQIGEGDVAGGLGATTGLVGSIAAPAAIVRGARALPIPRVGRNVPPAVQEAVQFGLQEGIPVDVATGTQNRFIRGVQRLSEESMLGSVVAERARGAQAEALTATGERLAQRASPAPVTAEQAGQAVRDALTSRAAAYNAAADAGYARLRAIEANAGGLSVDISATQAAMRPYFDALAREAELVPLMGDKARALTALDRLLNAPPSAPLSTADAALGELKALARVDDTFRRTAGQGVAAETVRNLEAAVRATAQRAGPDAFRALMDGRAATVNKFRTIRQLDSLQTEPVKVFNQATWAKDAGVAQLRELARVAPAEVRQIGRAWLENALEKATAEGGFSRAQGLLGDWQKLGPETRQLIFRDAAHVRDLDNFFLLAKKMAENPNPSGTALTLAQGGELTALMTAPLAGVSYTLTAPIIARLLLSPRTTQTLLQGLRLPVTATRARAAWVAEMGRLLKEQTPTAAPAAAEQGPPP